MNIRAVLMGLAFALFWSSAFSAARIIVAHAPPLAALSLRFVISGVLALGIALILKQSFRLTGAQWRGTIIFGVCQNALYLGLNFISMQWIEASVAAIIASMMPLMVALLGWLVFRERLRLMARIGLVAGLMGVALIMGSRLQGGVDILGVFLCFCASFALAVATLAVRGASSGGNLMVIVGLQMLIGALCLGMLSGVSETIAVVWSWQLIVAFAYSILVPGLLGTWIWFRLVNEIGAVKAATFHFLNPFFGVAVAAVLLGERIGLFDVIGVIIVGAGILAVQLSRQTTLPVAPPQPGG